MPHSVTTPRTDAVRKLSKRIQIQCIRTAPLLRIFIFERMASKSINLRVGRYALFFLSSKTSEMIFSVMTNELSNTYMLSSS
jgi:hypothetical protein